MERRRLIPALVLLLGLTSPALASSTADITLGNYNLLPNTPNQTIPIYVSGGAPVSGLNFNLQIGDGGPDLGGTPGPVFTHLDLVAGTIFQSDYEPPLDLGSFPQLLTWDIVTAGSPEYVSADGLLATVTVDTTGFAAGEEFPLSIASTLNGSTNFVYDGITPVPSSLTNGMITIVPEPSTALLLAAGGIFLSGIARVRTNRARGGVVSR